MSQQTASHRLRVVESALAQNLVRINAAPGPGIAPVRGGQGREQPSKRARTDAGASAAPTGAAATAAPPRAPPLARPPPPVAPGADGSAPALLRGEPRADADELYGEQEQALNAFLRLHPMLSVDSTSHPTLQLMANLINETSIPTQELEVVPRTYDEQMLRMPNTSVGERPCVLGERCVCVWLARWRFGDDTKKAFVGTEFLLPSQQRTFDQTGALPPTPGKCLLCSRYFHTFLYRLARSDPSFDAGRTVPLQAYANAVGVAEGKDYPTHCSPVNSADGYSPEVLLFADEEWTESEAARTPMANFLWRPVVRFSSNHYQYVVDSLSGLPRIVQVGMAPDEAAPPDFRQPAPQSSAAAEPA